MILLAFLFPLALYLMILGSVNRRRHPLMVYGPWDFAGILLAASGFLLLGGPGVLSILNDRWRTALIFGQDPTNSTTTTESLWQWWLAFMIVYFVAIVGGAGYFLWCARHSTSIYNVDRDTVLALLSRIFERLGLRPLRTGDMYYFSRISSDRGPLGAGERTSSESIQTTPSDAVTSMKVQTAPTPVVVMQNVILEIDAFQLMSHVTLRWEPVHTGLRQEIERELDRELDETPAPYHSLGGWLTIASTGLFFLTFAIGLGVLVYRVLNRIW